MTLPEQPLHADLRTLLGLRHTPDMRLRAIVRGLIPADIAAIRALNKVGSFVETGGFPMRIRQKVADGIRSEVDHSDLVR